MTIAGDISRISVSPSTQTPVRTDVLLTCICIFIVSDHKEAIVIITAHAKQPGFGARVKAKMETMMSHEVVRDYLISVWDPGVGIDEHLE